MGNDRLPRDTHPPTDGRTRMVAMMSLIKYLMRHFQPNNKLKLNIRDLLKGSCLLPWF